MRSSLLLTMVCAVSVVACVVDTGPGLDGGSEGTDEQSEEEEEITCEEAPLLELGRCERGGTGETCTGALEEDSTFVALDEGDAMQLVKGPQGSLMLLFLARTTGISPGDPGDPASQDNPLVDVRLFNDEDEQLSWYRGRVAFDAPDGMQTSTAGLFLVLEESPADLVAHELVAEASLRDREGEVRCGTAMIVVE